jgi:hypothetical protein
VGTRRQSVPLRPAFLQQGLYRQMTAGSPLEKIHYRAMPAPDHLPTLRRLLPQHQLRECRTPVPRLPGMTIPYYLFLGIKD